MKKCKLCGSLDTSLVILTTPLSHIIANYYQMEKLSLMATPRRHIESVTDLTSEESADLKQITALVMKHLKNKGFYVSKSNHKTHLHITTRNFNDDPHNVNINIQQVDAIKALF